MKNTVTFGSFKKLSNGDDCNGKDIIRNGQVVGYIQRQVQWTKNAGMSERYTGKVVGYTVIFFTLDAESKFPTLTEAVTYAKTV